MAVLATDGRARVEQLSDGRIAIWDGPAADPNGLALVPAAALEAAREIVALALPGHAVPSFTGTVERIAIHPPAGPGLSGRLRIMVAGRPVDLLIGWTDLIALAETARAALLAAEPASSSSGAGEN